MRLAAAAEARIDELGAMTREEAWPRWLETYETRFTPTGTFAGVPADMARWLDLWLVCDGAVIDGRTPLQAFGGDRPDPIDEHLAASAIGAWWVRGGRAPIVATAWNEEQPAMLHLRHEPLGFAGEGALLVGRGIAVSGRDVALVGRPVVVDPAAVDDVLAVLHAAPSDALIAALRWPEVRGHTAEGELVEQCLRSYDIADPDAAVAELRASPAATEADVLGHWEDDVTFHVHGARRGPPLEPPPERGVTWELCEEDREEPPRLGEVTVSFVDRELAVSAPTRTRADRLLHALPWNLQSMLGAPVREDLDRPDVLLRVIRERLEKLAPAMR